MLKEENRIFKNLYNELDGKLKMQLKETIGIIPMKLLKRGETDNK